MSTTDPNNFTAEEVLAYAAKAANASILPGVNRYVRTHGDGKLYDWRPLSDVNDALHLAQARNMTVSIRDNKVIAAVGGVWSQETAADNTQLNAAWCSAITKTAARIVFLLEMMGGARA